MTSRWLVLALTVLCAPGCQNNARASLQSPAPPSDVATDAREAMARRDWGAAAPLFRRAIASAPDSLALHHGLAICATYLDLRDEAMREFQWVLARGTAGSEETTVARSWLAQTNGPTANPADRSASERDGNDPKSGSGSVRGAVGWAEPGHSAQQPMNRKLLHLVGLKDTSTSGIRYSIRSDANGRYEFEHIVPGPYKLTDTIAGQPRWRLRITVAEAQDAIVDLDPNNSAKIHDDFPEPGPS